MSGCLTYEKKIDSTLSHKYKEQLNIIEDKIGIDGQYIIYVLLTLSIIVFLGIFESAITNFVGIIFPSYLSLRAIETLEADMEKQWITYWIIFSLFSIVDNFVWIFITYFPFYYFVKYLILVYMFLPNFQGAILIYDSIINDIFKKIEKNLDTRNMKNAIETIDKSNKYPKIDSVSPSKENYREISTDKKNSSSS